MLDPASALDLGPALLDLEVFHPEARPLPADRMRGFSAFYREQLRFGAGERLGATDLQRAYRAWASRRGEPPLNFKDLKLLMRARGHRQKLSNGSKYLDVRLAAAGEAEPDMPPAPISERAIALEAIRACRATLRRLERLIQLDS